MRSRQESSLWMEEVQVEAGAAVEVVRESGEGGGQGLGARYVKKIYQVFTFI